MVNPFEQTPAEKEEYVLDMLERGYSWPQIMKECHVSPNTISSVKKKFSDSFFVYYNIRHFTKMINWSQ
jgi:hypothetical protein